MKTRFFKLFVSLTIGSLSCLPVVNAEDTVTNAPLKSETPAVTPAANETKAEAATETETKLCSENMTPEIAEQFEILLNSWVAATSVCQIEIETGASNIKFDLKAYNEFLKRFEAFTNRSHDVHGKYLVEKGYTEEKEALAAIEQKRQQAVLDAKTAYTSQNFKCDDKVNSVKHDMFFLKDEKELCKKLEQMVAECSEPDLKNTKLITLNVESTTAPASTMEFTKVADEPDFNAELPDAPVVVGNTPYTIPDTNFSPKMHNEFDGGTPMVESDVVASNNSIPERNNTISQSNFFTQNFNKEIVKITAKDTNECLTKRPDQASERYYDMYSRLFTANMNCGKSNADIEWNKKFNQFTASNPTITDQLKPTLTPGETQSSFALSMWKQASNNFNAQRVNCEDTQFQKDFQNTASLNTNQIKEKIADSLCTISQ